MTEFSPLINSLNTLIHLEELQISDGLPALHIIPFLTVRKLWDHLLK